MIFENKICVITGGTGGIGTECVKILLELGVKFVAVIDLNNESCVNKFKELEKNFMTKVSFYPCDVSSVQLLKDTIDRVIKLMGTIDILINNVGIIDEHRPELTIDTNLRSVISSTLHFIDRIGRHKGGQGGSVINTSSIIGLANPLKVPIPTYIATKSAIVAFTKNMNENQFKNTGVRVMSLCPGCTDTSLINTMRTLSYVDFTLNETDVQNDIPQNPRFVASAMVKLLENGTSGDVYVCESNRFYLTKFMSHHQDFEV